MNYKKKTRGDSLFELVFYVAFAAIILFGFVACSACRGVGGFGPERTVENATVIDKYVDAGKESSHYMVSTDKGVFEVDNGFLLGIYNSDEIYGRILKGNIYTFEVEGKKNANFFFQDYPYIKSFVEIQKTETKVETQRR